LKSRLGEVSELHLGADQLRSLRLSKTKPLSLSTHSRLVR